MPSVARPGCCCRLGVAASPLRVPLWPLLGSLAADTGPRGRFRAGCGRLGAPGVRARPPCAFHRLRAGHQPAAVREDERRSTIEKRLKKGGKEAKRHCRLKRSRKNAMDLCEESSNDSAGIRYGPNGCHLGCLRGARIWPLLLFWTEY